MLTTATIQTATPGAKPYKLSDGAGLFLLVTPKGQTWWRMRYRLEGKEKMLSLGTFPAVSLDTARKRRNLIRLQLAQGLDPSEQRKAASAAQRQQQEEQEKVAHFSLDSDGALSLRLGKSFLMLTPAETVELRAFLDATRNVTPKD